MEEENEKDDEHRIQGTCREDDKEYELDNEADMHLVLKTDGDRNCREDTSCGKTSSKDTSTEAKCSRGSNKIKATQLPIPEVIQRLGTPASISRVIGSSPLPQRNEALETALDADMLEFYQLKDSLCETNLDAEGALQTVLSHTVGGLDYDGNMMITRAHERMKSLHIQMGQEIVQMFFSPKASQESTPKSMADSFQELSTPVMDPVP
ncbi:hypothetical protein R1flu_000406 [Riccia fluitans]|uniref:Uncharacterized protein n=1 Tax=Riccia fluitans TaxID=41844 RepID=A0ABD1Y0C4_9MARC